MTTRRVNLNTESVDNYLKAIYSLGGQEEERVTSNALAERLGVAPSSITNMLQKLASCSPALVEYEAAQEVFACHPPGGGERLRCCAIIA